MTIAEKRDLLGVYCDKTKCDECILEGKGLSSGVPCLDIDNAPETILDMALKMIREKDEDPIKPDYYNDTKIAPIDVIEDWDLDFCLGSALKYIKRCGKKDNNPSVQDLKKVIWYVERRIKELEEASV